MASPERELYNLTMAQLGSSYVDVECSFDDFKKIIKKALNKITPYYDGKRYVQASGKVIDLSLHDPIAITRVFNTKSSALISIEDYAFGGQNIILYSTDFRDRYISYTAYKMLYNQYMDLKGSDFRYIAPNLYVDGYNQDILIEMIVHPTVLSDVEETSMFFSWIQDYTIALTKEMIGNIRSKITTEGSPYRLDGEAKLQEAREEKANLESQLTGDIFVV